MEFSKVELAILNQLTQGNFTVSEIQIKLDKSNKVISEGIKRLRLKELITENGKEITPQKTILTSLLLRNFLPNPDFSKIIEGIRIKILAELLEPQTIDALSENLCIAKSTIYLHIRYLTKRSVVLRSADKYSFNKSLWSDLFELVLEVKRKDDLIDERVIPGSKIYEKKRGSILFEYNKLLDNAVPTAFSAYSEYGITIETPFIYQRIPSEKMNIAQIFLDSLIIANKELEFRFYVYATLFYAKHRKKLQMIHHPLVDKMNRVLNGEHLTDFPKPAEIIGKAQVYDINLSKD
jgi:predicted transcriptional regulator